MLALLGLLLFVGPAGTHSAALQQQPQNSCVSCHLEAGGELADPVEKVKNDVHGTHGLTCVSCHGGDANEADMERAMDRRKGFMKPSPKHIAAFCGKCHSNAEMMKRFNPSLRVDQETEYVTSVHGKRVAQGDEKPATCVSCHGNHGVTAVKDPTSPVYPTHVAETCGRCHANAEFMQPYGIPTDQYKKYVSSVHGEALLKKQDISAPTCNSCHGNHGAAPPGTTSVGNVCGVCHVRQAELLASSPHKAGFEELGLSQCLACHNNHDVKHPTDTLVGTTAGAVCIQCHDKGDRGFATAGNMHTQLIKLVTAIGSADALLDRARQAGMEISHAKFDLNGARDGLTNARVLVHTFSAGRFDKAIASGIDITEAARRAGDIAMAELQFRRKGLAVSLVVIAFAIVALYLKIRQIESQGTTGRST